MGGSSSTSLEEWAAETGDERVDATVGAGALGWPAASKIVRPALSPDWA